MPLRTNDQNGQLLNKIGTASHPEIKENRPKAVSARLSPCTHLPPKTWYVQVLTPNVVIFGGGPLGND